MEDQEEESDYDMQCTKPVTLQIKYKSGRPSLLYPDGLTVPCGKCLACRISKRREWSLRMLHELDNHEDSCFLTLTYDDEHLPTADSLCKRDLQLFIKRLRKSLEPRKIRYFACGEYGEETNRPHYHAIIFGLSLKDDDKKLVRQAWPFCDWNNYYINKKSFGLAEPDSIAYVAGYIDKKYSGDLANQEYKQKNREPVFRLLSLGIGKNYCDKYSEDLKNNMYVTIKGIKLSLPRYYINRLGIDTSQITKQAELTDCELTEHYTGLYMSSIDLYKAGLPKENEMLIEGVKAAKNQHDMTLQAKSKILRSRKV